MNIQLATHKKKKKEKDEDFRDESALFTYQQSHFSLCYDLLGSDRQTEKDVTARKSEKQGGDVLKEIVFFLFFCLNSKVFQSLRTCVRMLRAQPSGGAAVPVLQVISPLAALTTITYPCFHHQASLINNEINVFLQELILG